MRLGPIQEKLMERAQEGPFTLLQAEAAACDALMLAEVYIGDVSWQDEQQAILKSLRRLERRGLLEEVAYRVWRLPLRLVVEEAS